MSNFLKNGTVLPSGLLSHNAKAMLEGFKKSFQNNTLKAGIVIASYGIDDDANLSKLLPEYDVLAFEQNEDKGSTVGIYKNCTAASSLGSIADFLEVSYRPLEKQTTKGTVPSPSGQDGAIVLLLCLNGMSDTAIIIGSLSHPDRPTTIKGTGPHLEGEFNGVHIVVNEDGSTSLTFKGATNNDGTAVDDSQGNTEISIAKDGSYEVAHDSISQEFNRDGHATLTAKDEITNTTDTNFNVNSGKDTVVKATGDFNLSAKDIVMSASGSAQLQCNKLQIQAQSEIDVQGSQFSVQAESMAMIKAPTITIQGQVALGGPGGQPVLLLSTMMMGIGNLGAPVISTAISGYATQVTAQ